MLRPGLQLNQAWGQFRISRMFPLALMALLFLSGCKAFHQIDDSSKAINANNAAVKNSTSSITANSVAVDESSQSIRTNSLAVGESTQAIRDNKTAVDTSSSAIATNEAVVAQSTGAISSNTVAVNGSSQAINDNRSAVLQSTAAIKENAQALDDLLGLTKKLKENKPLAIIAIAVVLFLLVAPSILTMITLRKVKTMVDSHFWPQQEVRPATPSSAKKS